MLELFPHYHTCKVCHHSWPCNDADCIEDKTSKKMVIDVCKSHKEFKV